MQKGNHRSLLGYVFIAVGLVLLLGNLHILPYNITRYIFTWQMIPLGIGIYQLITRNFKGGLILITIGSLTWMQEFWRLSFQDYWPVILIAAGVGFFLKGRGHQKIHNNGPDSDQIDDLALFGGTKKIITDQSFKGGRITSIFGEVYLDLRNANLHEGKAEIDTFAIFGAFKTFVPSDWKVNTNMTCIFGGFNDKRTHEIPSVSENELTIKGVVLFGGGDLMH